MIPKRFVYATVLVAAMFIMVAMARGGGPAGRSGDQDQLLSEGVLADGCSDDHCSDEPCGEPTVFIDGDSGTIDVPSVGAMVVDLDEKKHFMVGEGVVKVEVVFMWNPAWDLTLDIGTGDCPHNGELLESQRSSTGNITLIYENAEGVPAGQWFAHLAPTDGSSHRGESCNYTLRAFLQMAHEECDDHSAGDESCH